MSTVTDQRTSGNKGTNTGYQIANVELQKLLLQRVTGSGGSMLISSTGTYTNQKFYAFIVQEDTIISMIKGGHPPSSSTNYLVTLGINGVTLKAGALFTLPLGEVITTIALSSGSLIGYKQTV
jgi:hypothetical protein